MALLRINLPGRPVELIDLGIARGRVAYMHGLALGGPIEYTPKRPGILERAKLDSAIERERRAIASAARPRCGYLMPISQEPCARRAGHKPNDHRTAEAVRKNIERRRRGYYGG